MYIESKKKAEDYGISGSYQVLSEIGEATKNFLGDTKVCNTVTYFSLSICRGCDNSNIYEINTLSCVYTMAYKMDSYKYPRHQAKTDLGTNCQGKPYFQLSHTT